MDSFNGIQSWLLDQPRLSNFEQVRVFYRSSRLQPVFALTELVVVSRSIFVVQSSNFVVLLCRSLSFTPCCTTCNKLERRKGTTRSAVSVGRCAMVEFGVFWSRHNPFFVPEHVEFYVPNIFTGLESFSRAFRGGDFGRLFLMDIGVVFSPSLWHGLILQPNELLWEY